MREQRAIEKPHNKTLANHLGSAGEDVVVGGVAVDVRAVVDWLRGQNHTGSVAGLRRRRGASVVHRAQSRHRVGVVLAAVGTRRAGCGSATIQLTGVRPATVGAPFGQAAGEREHVRPELAHER